MRSLARQLGMLARPRPPSQAGLLVGLFVVFLLLGSLVYHLLEGWTYLEALYFSFTTLTTIGFGDYLPSTPISKAAGQLRGGGRMWRFQRPSIAMAF